MRYRLAQVRALHDRLGVAHVRLPDGLGPRQLGALGRPTLGIVLCSETSSDIAHYSVLNGSDQLFATKYKLYLPTEVQLRAEIEAQKEIYLA